jgi:hypothetical protein
MQGTLDRKTGGNFFVLGNGIGEEFYRVLPVRQTPI